MMQKSSALNGNDAMTNATIEKLSGHAVTVNVETVDLLQYSRITGVDLRPMYTAGSLKGVPALAIALQLEPYLYVTGAVDKHATSGQDVFVNADSKAYEITSSSEDSLKYIDSKDDVYKSPLDYLYVLNKREYIDAVDCGLYENDSALFKDRLRSNLLGKSVYRLVPAEVETISLGDTDTTVRITDIDSHRVDNAETSLSSGQAVFATALTGIIDAYQDDLAKATIDARQRAREIDLDVVSQDEEELYAEQVRNSDSLMSSNMMEYETLDSDSVELLKNISFDDVTTDDALKSSQGGSSLLFDVDELIANIENEQEIASPAVVDAELTDEQKAEIDSFLRAEAEKEAPKRVVHERDDDELEL